VVVWDTAIPVSALQNSSTVQRLVEGTTRFHESGNGAFLYLGV